ncbi:tyrosine-type recombinase/integrase [Thermococcus sp.]
MLELETKGVEKDTISRVKHIINQFLNSLQEFNGYYILTIDSLMLHLQKIREKYSPQYYRKHVLYIKKLLKIANIEIAEMLKAKKVVSPDITIVTVQDVKNLLNLYKTLYDNKKLDEKNFDRLRLATLFCAVTGMRVFEFVRLRVSDINLENRTVHLRAEITKAKKERITFFTDEVQQLLEDYIKKYHLTSEDSLARLPQLQRPFKYKKELNQQKLRLKHMRKFFSQEWDRRNGNTTVKKILMGHSITDDINALHYSHHTTKELKEIYDKVMRHLRFLE